MSLHSDSPSGVTLGFDLVIQLSIVRIPLATSLAILALLPLGFAQRTEHFQVSGSESIGNEHTGSSVAIDGEWAVVGDYGATTPVGLATGACVVYRQTELGWIEWQVLAPSTGAFLQQFGYDVALSGDELFVGARRGGADHAGRVFVYQLINDHWEGVQELRAFDGGPGFTYGQGLAIDDQTLVVGSMGYPDETYVTGGLGTVYVYVRSTAGWVLSERIPLPNHSTTPHGLWSGFGWACALEGDVLVVGARGNGAHGMAFVYRRQSSGWVLESSLHLPQFSPDIELLFGSAVDIDNGVIVIGAPVSGTPLFWGPSMVAFFEYETTSQTWGLKQTVRASDASLSPGGLDKFGHALSLHGGRLIVGAYNGSYNSFHSGTAYIFEKTNGLWSEIERLVPTDPNPATGNPANFSSSVAFDGPSGRILIGSLDTLVPGSPGNPGKAYFFDINQGPVVCAGAPNETLMPTRLTVTGSRRVADANLALSVYDGPPGLMGIYLIGPGGPPVPFGVAGSLCVGQPFSRLTGIKAIGTEGSAMHQIDFTSGSAANLISPGAKLTFQFAHRDKVSGTGQATINASDAIEVVFE